MSFGQSVENLFYISFLIKEGKAKLELNQDTNILMLSAASAPTKDDYQNGLKKKQIIMELDYQSWEGLIAFFNIKRSIIPDRQAYNSNEMVTSYIVE
ncbi:hypothetical protein K502DRAFT_299990 [Neoconidiobolus thromboides FSU 785]|nr:hypothetical protein K502DRAFT_299990 [Neoconidiobolus thromboides FSU 785]